MTIKAFEPFICGGVASCTAEFFTFPIDLVKTRLQIQGQQVELIGTTSKAMKYNGMLNCFTVIIREEGLRSLYYGIKPALLRQASYGTLKLGFYQYMKKLFLQRPEDQKLVYNIFFACVSGASANAICNPTDVLKVRMQSCQSDFKNKPMLHSFIDIYRKEGLKGLYRGVYPNAQRAAVIAAAELSTYDSFKQLLIRRLSFDDNSTTHFVSSAVAGLCAASASTPIDVVKTRVMNQRKLKDNTNKNKIYKGSLDCLAKTVKHEGVMALYKGFLPSYIRLGPWNVLFFMTYENCKKIFPEY